VEEAGVEVVFVIIIIVVDVVAVAVVVVASRGGGKCSLRKPVSFDGEDCRTLILVL
jgi:hypothetical protein